MIPRLPSVAAQVAGNGNSDLALSGEPNRSANNRFERKIIPMTKPLSERLAEAFDKSSYLESGAWVSDNIDEILTALRAHEAEGWRDISSAPKGELIDIWIKHSDGSGFRWTDCYYDKITDEWRTSAHSGHVVWVTAKSVTHWRPLPTKPERT